ncbi:2-keto-4-pentenoate hydratase [Mesorhizobium sangaii]|uniref:2-keto-4-pentenoate hydratase n=1 Tax=Mesorhizobium sangaii TaxID=505389 RepID=A0A841PUF4_9HYPH|nr:fumarylacetoacetate hydrolase family protein [Mesorhizobium sangaii]MBB6413789.1 2-keto-4-pentenoate hydratase [Mesorhizobium sangaii]
MSDIASEFSKGLAQKLVAAHRSDYRVPADTSDLAALTRPQALSIQHDIVTALSSIGGWKVAALPDGDLISAPLLKSRLFHSPALISPAVYGLGGVECEIAFHFARQPVPGRDGFVSEHIIEAIDGACAAVEIADSRWASKFSIPRNAMVADLLANGALICGPLNKNWRDKPLDTLQARLGINGETICQTTGGHPRGDLVGLLVLLANDLRTRGIALRPGEIVTTGSYTGFHTANPGDQIVAEFDGFAPVSVTFDKFENSGDIYALR